MDQFVAYIESLLPPGLDLESLLKAAGVLLIGIFVIGILARLIFGRKSVLNRSLSSAINILFIYIVTVVIQSFGVDLGFLLSPLPFVSIDGEYLQIFSLLHSDYASICEQMLSMVILAFLANIADSWLPQGKNVIGWFFFRCISVLLAMVLHLVATALITVLLPEGLLYWAPMILLGALVLMIVLGALKLLFAITNPLFAALYSFFFGHKIGKMIYQAVLTTAIITCIVYVLNYFGMSAVCIAQSALGAYVPVLAVLLIVWYIIGNLL